MKSKILLGALLMLIVIQLFPIDKTNPPSDLNTSFEVIEQVDFDNLTLLKKACYNCHSHDTSYPSYTRFQPIGWFTKGHVKGGRQKVNFSLWSTFDQKKKNHYLEECVEVLEEGRMPLKSYTWMHKESKLDASQKQSLVALFKRLQK